MRVSAIIGIFSITALILFDACGPPPDRSQRRERSTSRRTVDRNTRGDIYHRVRDINGTTLTLSDGHEVALIGVRSNPEIESFLRQFLESGQRVRYEFDSKNVPRRPDKQRQFYAYVTDEDGVDLSGMLLRRKIAKLERHKFLRDSLYPYKQYATATAVTDVSTRFPVNRVRNASFHVYKFVNGRQVGTGSGFYLTTDGIGVSNYHVFEGGDAFLVNSCGDGSSHRVTEVLAYDENDDYVIFTVGGLSDKVEALSITKQVPEQGDQIYVYGNPKGLDCVLSDGIVSALREMSGSDIIQITAPISPGNSGSPVTNERGEVIGIATFKQRACENCNFAVSIQELSKDLTRVTGGL